MLATQSTAHAWWSVMRSSCRWHRIIICKDSYRERERERVPMFSYRNRSDSVPIVFLALAASRLRSTLTLEIFGTSIVSSRPSHDARQPSRGIGSPRTVSRSHASSSYPALNVLNRIAIAAESSASQRASWSQYWWAPCFLWKHEPFLPRSTQASSLHNQFASSGFIIRICLQTKLC
jgi:hypothetical protein